MVWYVSNVDVGGILGLMVVCLAETVALSF